ncbi:hypothetical protein GOB93_05170 [Acetobacter musti]|uniref:Uncharacterized protein n=1 Tax=Acetobacter musti TaxID=864732 RepID=A0ABX0JPL3_9PROT|nr:hypothetical protein [Acetobacter musti]
MSSELTQPDSSQNGDYGKISPCRDQNGGLHRKGVPHRKVLFASDVTLFGQMRASGVTCRTHR